MQASSKAAPAVTVVIPHLRNRPMLNLCLDALRKTIFRDFSVIIVDNGGDASDLAGLESDYPEIFVLHLPENAGYAGGCNEGLKYANSPYVIFLNDDTIVDPEWLGCLVEAAERDPKVGALQPKILSLPERRCGRRVFDYAGAAGGLIDWLGFPYCLGRSFGGREVDAGQYDEPRDIFWASGVALFARREVVEKLGGFEAGFFMHMEEIDLCWRMLLAGYRVRSVPQSVVWHEGGASLAEGSPMKVYYNHRNALFTLLRNRSAAPLVALLPLRLVLEAAAMLYYLAGGKAGMARATQVARAFIDVLRRLPETLRQRRKIQRARIVGDQDLFRNAPLSIFLLRPSD
ncbi:glycosyltransferase family 2 protein [Chlorobaculum sp. MV4-Y]|jgi:GT2 family glycosyltransferase|uniref:glycosyltransferase family 2 protein n=1 Tax=Chlorobaculum sp. MV4-Y TaxID=2976335 RepID=UPI0021B050F8|nr:glycosyltransferase family 2 protein [Chlorobaculum sp. MV4-Y]UWX57090.1 glycosyltransferase family 2 protein [Chlorobaculum sp. MV4-Y]